MGSTLWESLVTIVSGILTVALVAVIVGKNAQTAGVLQASTGGLAQDITAAQGPVLGNSMAA